MMTGQLKYLSETRLDRPAMVVGWHGDAGMTGDRVIALLNQTFKMKPLAEIEPVGFFQLSGVEVASDLAKLPDSSFSYSKEVPLIAFISDIPAYEVHQFLERVLDLAAKHEVSHMIIIGALPVMASHNTPSTLMANLSTPLLRDWLSGEGVKADMDYISPPGQKPAIGTYLTWEARQHGVEAVSLWSPVPFYLAPLTDETGAARILSFLRHKLALPVNTQEAEDSARRQREKIAGLRASEPEVDKSLSMLESNLSLTEYEAGALAASVRQALS
ncbi:PAC2 family protein [Dehalogenimonas sp. 4OHTPN]|uniref:PAC2 family protein n=1 Tax=Dehalogenimonas sp. 4OHTPN TaxID=3166643 RepID=A0AAU8G8B0_9CHLR